MNRFGQFSEEIQRYPLHSNGSIDVPKALANLVESSTGAVFIDTNFSIDLVWKEATMKDTLEQAKETTNLNLKGFLENAYIHPLFKSADDTGSDSDNDITTGEWEQEPTLIATKRTSKRFTPLPSKDGGSSLPLG